MEQTEQKVPKEERDDLVRVTVDLREGILGELYVAAALTGHSKTTCIQTAIKLYRKFLEEQKKKNVIYIEEPNGTLRKITVR